MLSGIWEGSDRYIYFSPLSTSGGSEIAFMLKTLYGWYYDRSAETNTFASYKRPQNSVSVLEPETVRIQYGDIWNRLLPPSSNGSHSSGVGEIVLEYKDKSSVKIPASVIDGKLYLNFAVKQDSDDNPAGQNDNPIYGYWQGVGESSGITISAPIISEELTSFYITQEAVYHIRYWQTDMEYTAAKASFSDGDKTFSVAKHIKSAGKIYTCVTGRSLQIRNVEKSSFNIEDYVIDSTGTICAFGKPYLVKTEGESDVESYMKLALDANKRRKPDPPPLFPPSDINWHWDDINRLEKGNELIQEVRNRQIQFSRQSQNQSYNQMSD